MASTAITVDVGTLERFESSILGFAVDYPAGWTVADSPLEGLVGFTAPVGDSAVTPNFNVSTGEVPEAITAADYYDVERDRLDANLAELRVLEEVNVDVDGYLGRGFTLVTKQGDLDVGISRMIVLVEGKAWEVTFFAEATQLETFAPVVTAIFRSFEILD